MKRLLSRPMIPVLAALGALLALPADAQEEQLLVPPISVESVSIEPESPAADTLCRLRVKLRNEGDKIASRLGFAVSLNGQDLGVYRNQIFMYPIEPGTSREIDLYNFWTTETSRGMPEDGKLRVEVTLREATWTRMATETDDDGEIEVWTPIGPVEGLPSSGGIVVQMKTAAKAAGG